MNTLGKSTHFDSGPPRKGVRGYWYFTALFALFALLATSIDANVADRVKIEDLPGDFVRILKLSEFFAHGFGVMVVLCGIWLLSVENRRFIPRVLMCALFPGMTVQLVKLLVGRERPGKYLGNLPEDCSITWLGWLPEGTWNLEYAFQSFPSAHTTTAVGFAIGLAWVFPRGRYLFFALAGLASFQRIVFNAHWFSDVIAGLTLATMMGGALTQNWGLGYYFGRFERYCEIGRQQRDGFVSRVNESRRPSHQSPLGQQTSEQSPDHKIDASDLIHGFVDIQITANRKTLDQQYMLASRHALDPQHAKTRKKSRKAA